MDFWELTARLNRQFMLPLYFVSPAGNFDKLFVLTCTFIVTQQWRSEIQLYVGQ